MPFECLEYVASWKAKVASKRKALTKVSGRGGPEDNILWILSHLPYIVDLAHSNLSIRALYDTISSISAESPSPQAPSKR